jgi:Tfp pilus assembly protein PilE
MMPNPWLIIGVIFVVLGTYKYGTYSGYKERDQEMQAEIARLNAQSRAKEQKLAEDLNQTSSQLKEANDVVTQKQSSLDAAIRAGRVRLPAPSCPQGSASATPPSGNNQAGSESDTETLRLIAEIAAEGDRAINKLNACITAYEQVRSQVNDSNR